MPLVSLRDWVEVVPFVVERPESRGAYNVTLPEPATNADLTAAIGSALRRPTPLRVPAPLIRLGLGELSGELVGSVRLRPRRLLDEGFTFRDPDVRALVRAGLHQTKSGPS
jgi:NAD dependent epimerase/dehydratase family enzyme